MELVEKEKLIEIIMKSPVWTGLDAIARINAMDSIDIVRCKECRHWCCHDDVDYDQSKFTYYCEVHGISLEGDEFCSYGERKSDE